MLWRGRLEIPSHILQLGGYVGENSRRMIDITPIEWIGNVAVTHPEFLFALPLFMSVFARPFSWTRVMNHRTRWEKCCSLTGVIAPFALQIICLRHTLQPRPWGKFCLISLEQDMLFFIHQ
jgi:hypothetical protein